ncbi:MAG TPA: hypothetical protein VK002_00255 [Rubricoccaceae bacterium]|nr:hypothetical protein [Rubricoccaceae bacterium]
MPRRPARALPAYVDTPAGLVTPAGTRFRTSERLLEEWAGPVFAYEPLGEIVRRAEVWVRAPATLALLALPVFLFVVPAWAAGLLALVLYASASLALPAAPSRWAGRVLAVLEKPLVQGAYYVLVLSWLGTGGALAATAVGLAGFVGFRLGAVQALLAPVLAQAHARLYPLPPADQVLRAHVVRAALRHGVRLPELARLERSARAAWRR